MKVFEVGQWTRLAPASTSRSRLALGQVDRVAVDGAFAQQALRLVGVEVVARLREEVLHPGDLVGLFGQMGLHQAVGILAPERAERRELFGRRGGREARGDDVGQPVHPVPFLQAARLLSS